MEHIAMLHVLVCALEDVIRLVADVLDVVVVLVLVETRLEIMVDAAHHAVRLALFIVEVHA